MHPPALVEREHELALIRDTLSAALDGRGQMLVLEGEAGIGKTALLAHAAEEASKLGLRCFSARAGVFERSLGFGMARELFEASAVRARATERSVMLAGSASLAARLLGVDVPGEALNGPVASGEEAVDHGLYWLVANLAEQRPIALLLDDAHWCDEPTLKWLLYLLRRIEGLRVAIVVAVRGGEPDSPTGLLAALAAEPAARTAMLSPLGHDGTAALLEREYGTPVAPQFSLACHEWTAGNPMFVSALASELAAEGIEPVEGSAAGIRRLTPPSITRVTLLRLARLPAAAVELARALAVLRSGDLRTAARLAAIEDAVAAEAADVLRAARILDPGQLPRFSHPLVASVVYEDLSSARRAADHKLAARHLVDVGGSDELVVAQLLRCPPSADEWVVDVLTSGAERELERGSARTASELLRRAVKEPPSVARLAGVLFELGLAESLAGDGIAAVTSLRAALEASADVSQRAGIALLLGRLLVRAGMNSEAVDVLEPAIELLESEDADLRLQLEASLLTAARLDVRLAGLAVKRAERLASDLESDAHGARLIAAQLAWGATGAGRSAALSVELARQALSDGRLITEAPLTPDTYLLPILMLSLCDELDDADRHCRRAIELARETGFVPAYAGTACFQSGVAYLSGRLDEAEVLARDALRLAGESADFALVDGLARVYLANVLIDRDQLPEASEVLGEIASLRELPHSWGADLLLAAGRMRTSEQRPADALELFLACGDRCLEHHVKNPAWLPWRSQAALVLQQLGESERATELSDEELWRARRFGARRTLGVALRARGLIERGTTGLELLRESAEVLSKSPARLEYARTLVARGSALRRAGHRADARDPLSEGLALAERCQALSLSREAETELEACGARPRSVMRRGADSLTPSERRVCEMAAGGMSNPQIAQALFVTRATVESHLHSAYRKLEVPGRKQLVGALHDGSGS
jgi:ATP/maltotriose-dependent transcriptional regulator MalT